MKRENVEFFAGLLMIAALPWLAFAEWATGTQGRDWRGQKRGMAPGILGLLAWVSFGVQALMITLIGLLIRSIS